jgi:Tol biopolymer transport system component
LVQNPEPSRSGPDSWTGREISHFTIQSEIADGVYKARDNQTSKPALFRLLDAGVDAAAFARFEQDAAALNGLKHPNIARILETGEVDGRRYIVSEQPEGEALDTMMSRKRLPRAETTAYAVQIADALAAAHGAGIAHGGLHPAAVVARSKRYAKVLDFGIARLAPPPDPYLSPEQIEGKETGFHSDIFSFGSLLYQMCADKPAFETREAILKGEPLPLARATSRAPAGAEKIVARCLRKDPAERYPSAAALQADLKRMHGEDQARMSGARWLSPFWERVLVRSFAGALAFAVLTAGYLFWRSRPEKERSLDPSISQLTTDSGFYVEPAISRDGRTVAFASDRGADGNLDIWTQPAGGGALTQVTNHASDDHEPAISPDGASIAFRSERDGGGIYIVPSHGGEARRLAPFGRRPRFSPDGQWIAYWTGPTGVAPAADGEFKIHIVPARGGEPRQLRPDFSSASYPVWAPDGERILFLGRADSGINALTTLDWWLTPVDANAGPEKRIAKTNACINFYKNNIVNDFQCPIPGDWDGKHLYFSANASGAANLWRAELDAENVVTATPLKVTSGDNLEVQPYLAPGGHMVFARQSLNADIWSIPVALNEGKLSGEPKRITKDPALDLYPTLTSDGARLAFLSNRGGHYNPWTLDLKTGAETPVIQAQQDQMWPRISPNGAIVAYTEMRIGRFEHFFAPAGGGKVEVLCEDCGPIISDFHPDGRSVLVDFVSSRKLTSISLVKLGSHDRVQILQHPDRNLMQARFSADGRWIAFVARKNSGQSQIFVAPFRGEAPSPESTWTAVTGGDSWDTAPNWSPDGGLIYYTSGRDGFRCVWARRLDAARRPAGEPFPVFHFHTARRSPALVPLNGMDLSVGGGQIYLSLGELSGSIWKAEVPD